MTTLNNSFGLEYAPTPFLMRIGRREILITRDFRKRFYPINPIVVLFGRWLLILSKAH
jgi:hypothetical protein